MHPLFQTGRADVSAVELLGRMFATSSSSYERVHLSQRAPLHKVALHISRHSGHERHVLVNGPTLQQQGTPSLIRLHI